MASKRSIELFYDVLSPYAYIGFQILRRYEPIWHVEVTRTPVLIGGIMKATGNQAPGLNPYKQKHMINDIQRQCESYKIPYTQHPDLMAKLFKQGSLKAQRLLVAAALDVPSSLSDLSHHLLLASWGQALDITDDDVLLAACAQAGLDQDQGHRLVERTVDPVVKEQLKTNTERAVSYDVLDCLRSLSMIETCTLARTASS
eukprot:TRINITY_DN2561_c0_g1_i2.p1 TRINITY_DN2561_c0_g1~~TRINITY_DN2561_c0_g1_i2.p1  ORF type:complete len:201 (+),score=33.47 TRINITY_DN2561_c0_g1_i2:63-665(+)